MSSIENIVDYENGETPMTDYQFKRYEEYRDKCETLEKQLALFQGDKSNQNDYGMTDFQFKQIIEMVYQILKSNIEAGKSPEEVLKIVVALKEHSISSANPND